MIKLFSRQSRLKFLEDKLLEVSAKPFVLPIKHRLAMKGRVMERIDAVMAHEEIGFEQLAHELEKLTLTVEPTSRFKVHTREHVMDFLSLRTQRLWLKDLFKDLFARRSYWSAAMAGLVLFVSTFGYVAHFPNVSAAKVSTVNSIRGVVSIERAGSIFQGVEGFLVQEGDRIMTGEDGWLDVVFMDDSLLTVGPGTLIEVSKLWAAPENEAHTSVTVDVEHGRVWATVLNLLPNDSMFVVSSGEMKALVDRKGSFDFIVSDEAKRLRVFYNLVNFNIRDAGVSRDGTLGPNLELTLMDQNLSIENNGSLEALKSSDVWIQSNLQNQATHRARLDDYYTERVEQQAGVLPGDVRYSLKRGLEQARLWMSFDGKARSNLHFSLAQTRFAEATALANRGDEMAFKNVLNDYQKILVDLSESEGDHQASMKALLDENKKVVEGVASVGPLYDVRNFVDETAALVISNESERQMYQLSTTADRLGLALELIQIEAYDLALTSLEDYQVGFERVLSELSLLEFEDRRDVVFEILDQKLRDLQQLKLMGAVLDDMEVGTGEVNAPIQEQLRSLHEDTLYQLNTLVLNLKERAVLELKTFLEDAKDEERIQLEVLGRLKKSVPLDLEFISLINDVEGLYGDQSNQVLLLKDVLPTSKSAEALPLQDYLNGQFEGSGIPGEKEVGQGS